MAVNLIKNGSFEIGTDLGDGISLNPGATNIQNWVVTRANIDYLGTYWEAADGNRSLDLNGSPGFGGIAQTFNTTPGAKYQVTFDIGGNPESGPIIKKMQVEAPTIFLDICGHMSRNLLPR